MHGMSLRREGAQLILDTAGQVCSTTKELVGSQTLEQVIAWYLEDRTRQGSRVLTDVDDDLGTDTGRERVTALLRALAVVPLEQAVLLAPGSEPYLERRDALHRFVQDLYDYWRSFDRFMVCHSLQGPDGHDRRPYRTFNATTEELTHTVRALYRDICENITGQHPRVYRQVAAGCEVGLIAVECAWPCPEAYQTLLPGIPVIRQVLLNPPLILRPPMNRRTGQFRKVEDNPLAGLELAPEDWLCYPAQVGPLTVFVYFHRAFIGLGCSLANLFELATDEQVARGPDAVYLFGAPPEQLARYGELPTIFHEDLESDLLVAAVPLEDRFGYFGYLKKMVLTLHNAVMMRRGRMPFHGAMVRVEVRDGGSATILLIGDTATGKSECLEAFRVIGEEQIADLTIIADDMGSLEVADDCQVLGYGTEIGAFIRLDDLQHGYAFNQVDRAILHNPQLVNARVILPVTTIEDVLRGHPVDIVLYANNYEQVDEAHPVIEPCEDLPHALAVFREASAMAKGTTTATGLVHTYFANIFGPPQYRARHEELAVSTFAALHGTGAFVGQLRTRLGIPGYESSGPAEAAQALLELVARRSG